MHCFIDISEIETESEYLEGTETALVCALHVQTNWLVKLIQRWQCSDVSVRIQAIYPVDVISQSCFIISVWIKRRWRTVSGSRCCNTCRFLKYMRTSSLAADRTCRFVACMTADDRRIRSSYLRISDMLVSALQNSAARTTGSCVVLIVGTELLWPAIV